MSLPAGPHEHHQISIRISPNALSTVRWILSQIQPSHTLIPRLFNITSLSHQIYLTSPFHPYPHPPHFTEL
ncbi:hypothetical protein RIF29_00773 [Crotalaria pallida]|uniref:Uncharacterized protein n=1 Tax=Crotalaria pallida TaxID=3830 RepID=A0AAN9P6Q5_CROPI